MSSKTEFLLKQGVKQARFYSPVISRGTLWVATGCLGVMLKTLYEWKSAGTVLPIDIKILWISVAYTAVDKCLTYMDTTVARFKDEKKMAEKKREETEQVERLKTLG